MSLNLLPEPDRVVGPAERLIRYIHWRQTLDDGRLQSAAFRSNEGLSVDRAGLRDEAHAAIYVAGRAAQNRLAELLKHKAESTWDAEDARKRRQAAISAERGP